ncbi:MAG TPA: DUF4424 family protein [Fimbriimonas sp.]
MVRSATAALLLTGAAFANDTALTTGGTPKMMRRHRSVAMRSEVVRMTVGDRTVLVDCTFVFENLSSRPATIQMGFPDVGFAAGDPDEEYGPDWRRTPPKSSFESFESWVNGRKVPVRLIRSERPGKFWHVKTVVFPARRRVVVRDRYVQIVGFGPARLSGDAFGWPSRAGYFLHTGASWRGPIGSSEVIVTFRRKGMSGNLRPWRIPAKDWFDGAPRRDWSHERGRVFYTGPCKPKVHGQTLRFVRKNWHPSVTDDIGLVFDLKRVQPLGIWSGHRVRAM